MFRGFPEEAYEFFAAVREDTSWSTVSSRAAQHERALRAPMEELCAELADEFGPAKVYRLHRSPSLWVRQHAYVEVCDTIAYGVSVSLDGLGVEGGWLRSDRGQVERFRARAASELGPILDALADYELLGERLRTGPELLRWRSLVAAREFGRLEGRRALAAVRRRWRELRPLVEWLAASVGPRSGR